MLYLGWVCLLLVLGYAVARQRYLLSPTSVFLAYSALALPLSYLLAGILNVPSVFYASVTQIPSGSAYAALFATILALAGFYFGRYRFPAIRIHGATRRISRMRLSVLLVCCSVLALACAMQLAYDLGGIARILSELGAVRSGELTGRGAQVYAVTMLLPTVMQWWLICALRDNNPNKRFVFALCLASCFLGGVFGFRGPVVALLLQVMAIWYLFTKRPSRRVLISVLLGLIPLTMVSGILRLTNNEVAFETISSADTSVILAYLSDTALTRVRGVEAFSILQQYVDSHGFSFFIGNIRETLLSLLPSFLINKPISVTETIATQVFSNYLFNAGIIRDIYGGVSYTYISEGYWNFGYFGVLLYGIAIGAVFKTCESIQRKANPNNVEIALYKAVAGFTLLLVEATQLGINAIVLNLFVNLLIIFILSLRIGGERHAISASKVKIINYHH